MKKLCCWMLLGLLVACGAAKKEEKLADKDKEKKEEKVPVEVAQVGTGFIEATLSASANLETEAQVAVYSRTSNLLKTLLVEEGDHVAKGDVLARLDDETQKIAREKAQATFEKNEKEYLRQKSLFEQKMISQQVFNDTLF
ncbi:MAG: biotin/lipoyl-binding protein, partial [Acidobacteria bacterium]|nr:biotin/lipoyl-binding protein [Acidobacteriota bacterium]